MSILQSAFKSRSVTALTLLQWGTYLGIASVPSMLLIQQALFVLGIPATSPALQAVTLAGIALSYTLIIAGKVWSVRELLRSPALQGALACDVLVVGGWTMNLLMGGTFQLLSALLLLSFVWLTVYLMQLARSRDAAQAEAQGLKTLNSALAYIGLEGAQLLMRLFGVESSLLQLLARAATAFAAVFGLLSFVVLVVLTRRAVRDAPPDFLS